MLAIIKNVSPLKKKQEKESTEETKKTVKHVSFYSADGEAAAKGETDSSLVGSSLKTAEESTENINANTDEKFTEPNSPRSNESILGSVKFEENGENIAINESKENEKELKREKVSQVKRGNAQIKLENNNEFPTTSPVLNDIASLLQISRENDQSSEIAKNLKELKKKNRSKTTSQSSESTSNNAADTEEKKAGKANTDETISDQNQIVDSNCEAEESVKPKPKKILKLTDINFFMRGAPETNVKGKAKKKKINKEKEPANAVKSVKDEESKKDCKFGHRDKQTHHKSKEAVKEIFGESSSSDASFSDSQDSNSELEGDSNEKPLTFKKTIAGGLDYIPDNVTDTVGHGSIKKRVAHGPAGQVRCPFLFIALMLFLLLSY